MTIQRDYKGKSQEGNSRGNAYTETWWGTEEECREFTAGLKPGALDFSGKFGYETYRMSQRGGTIYQVELRYSNTIDSAGQIILEPAGPTNHDLDIALIDMPLETCKLYRTHWNYHLAALEGEYTPQWWEDATSLVITGDDNKKYHWIKNVADAYGLKPVNGKAWKILQPRTMPGVEARQLPVYTIREWSFHHNEMKAFWATAPRAGQIGTPKLGDYNIVKNNGGNWKFFGGQITSSGLTGKPYKAFTIWKHAPVDGWKQELYGPGAF